jgi:hypothetical protein
MRVNGNCARRRLATRYLIVAVSALLICWMAFHDPSASLRKTATNRPLSVIAFSSRELSVWLPGL